MGIKEKTEHRWRFGGQLGVEVLNSGLEAHSSRALLLNMESGPTTGVSPGSSLEMQNPRATGSESAFQWNAGVSAHCSLRSPPVEGHSGCSSFITLSITVIFFCRLLEALVQKEKELQALLHYAIEEKDQEIKHLKLKSQPIGE